MNGHDVAIDFMQLSDEERARFFNILGVHYRHLECKDRTQAVTGIANRMDLVGYNYLDELIERWEELN